MIIQLKSIITFPLLDYSVIWLKKDGANIEPYKERAKIKSKRICVEALDIKNESECSRLSVLRSRT